MLIVYVNCFSVLYCIYSVCSVWCSLVYCFLRRRYSNSVSEVLNITFDLRYQTDGLRHFYKVVVM